jgi:YfiH family protein
VSGAARIRRVITSRPGGVSQGPYASFNLAGHVGDDAAAVAANRRRLADAMNLPPERVVWLDQVHGTAVRVIDQPAAEPLPATDAAVTAEPGLAVAVLVADCVPVLLGDAEAGLVAAVHAGRVGAAAGVVRRVLESMWQLGAEPARTEALLGPAICGACYEVPAGMQAEVEQRLPGSACATSTGGTGLDLRAGLAAQLTAHGVARVALDSRCTAEDPELFSYRRDGSTGRQAAVIWLEP